MRVGGGSEKNVYKLPGQDQCFFIPHKWSSEENWNALIQCEKMLLDQMSELGLKTQRFEIVRLEISEPEKPSYTVNVLLTKDFESLCQEESLAIYNVKGDTKVIGKAPNFVAMQEQFKAKDFVQKMFEKIIVEYALGITFGLPISILNSVDDSEHYCFELSKDPSRPPLVRYMFWDVVSDFSGVQLPLVPTLSGLKAGSKKGKGVQGLSFLANQVACAMLEMNRTRIKDSWGFVGSVQDSITVALNDDDFLNQALIQARQKSIHFLKQLLLGIQKVDKPLESEQFVELMKSVISTSDLGLVTQCFQLPQAEGLPNKAIFELLEFARKYESQSVVNYLEDQKKLEVTTRLAPIDQALAELRIKLTTVNQYYYARAHKEAHRLLEKLESSRDLYRDKLSREEFSIKMEIDFQAECVSAIRIARPILENDLGWNDYIQNLLKTFANKIYATVGKEHLFFQLVESESLKAVKSVARDMMPNNNDITMTLGLQL